MKTLTNFEELAKAKTGTVVRIDLNIDVTEDLKPVIAKALKHFKKSHDFNLQGYGYYMTLGGSFTGFGDYEGECIALHSNAKNVVIFTAEDLFTDATMRFYAEELETGYIDFNVEVKTLTATEYAKEVKEAIEAAAKAKEAKKSKKKLTTAKKQKQTTKAKKAVTSENKKDSDKMDS